VLDCVNERTSDEKRYSVQSYSEGIDKRRMTEGKSQQRSGKRVQIPARSKGHVMGREEVDMFLGVTTNTIWLWATTSLSFRGGRVSITTEN
jgi:hypothetical protein